MSSSSAQHRQPIPGIKRVISTARLIVVTVAGFLSTCLPTLAASGNSRPNVIVILTDDNSQ
ncbi:MAG: hypothetical protein O2945_19710 [Planctomycetota bacterium]|nr:hypothetical protein [Planctomycetota bacterium]